MTFARNENIGYGHLKSVIVDMTMSLKLDSFWLYNTGAICILQFPAQIYADSIVQILNSKSVIYS